MSARSETGHKHASCCVVKPTKKFWGVGLKLYSPPPAIKKHPRIHAVNAIQVLNLYISGNIFILKGVGELILGRGLTTLALAFLTVMC